jgi:hypothetical protein
VTAQLSWYIGITGIYGFDIDILDLSASLVFAGCFADCLPSVTTIRDSILVLVYEEGRDQLN